MAWDEKRVFLPYRITEPQQMERYFEQMAAEGWYPVSVGTYTAKFRKGKPRELRFCIDFTDVGKKEEELRRYTALCGDAGWRFQLKADAGWLLFRTGDPEAPPLQTDPAMAVKDFKKTFWNQFWGNAGLSAAVFLWGILDLGLNFSRIIRFLTDLNTMLEIYFVYLFLLLAGFLLVNAAFHLRGYFAARKALRTAQPLPDISGKTVRRRVAWRKALLWAAAVPLPLSVGYDVWAGTLRPGAEQWIAMALGAAVAAGGFFLKKEWLDRWARRTAWIVGGFFLAVGVVLSYPLYRMEASVFPENSPEISAADFMEVTKSDIDRWEYGHTPFCERWEVWSSGSKQVSENVYDGMTIFYTAYRSATPGIARRLLAEEDTTAQAIYDGGLPRTSLDWGVEEAYQLGEQYVMLRDGNGALVYALMGGQTAEDCRLVLLEQLEKLRD